MSGRCDRAAQKTGSARLHMPALRRPLIAAERARSSGHRHAHVARRRLMCRDACPARRGNPRLRIATVLCRSSRLCGNGDRRNSLRCTAPSCPTTPGHQDTRTMPLRDWASARATDTRKFATSCPLQRTRRRLCGCRPPRRLHRGTPTSVLGSYPELECLRAPVSQRTKLFLEGRARFASGHHHTVAQPRGQQASRSSRDPATQAVRPFVTRRVDRDVGREPIRDEADDLTPRTRRHSPMSRHGRGGRSRREVNSDAS